MPSLIVTIISIALVVIMSAAAIYYGGDVFSEQGKNVEAAKLSTNATQMEGAIKVYHAEKGDYPSSAQNLIDAGYLSIEVPGNWSFEQDYIVTSVTDENSCLTLNKMYGLDLVPACDDAAYVGKTHCCLDPA